MYTAAARGPHNRTKARRHTKTGRSRAETARCTRPHTYAPCTPSLPHARADTTASVTFFSCNTVVAAKCSFVVVGQCFYPAARPVAHSPPLCAFQVAARRAGGIRAPRPVSNGTTQTFWGHMVQEMCGNWLQRFVPKTFQNWKHTLRETS